jgi:predicted porin
LGLALKYNQGPLNAVFYNGKASAGSIAAAGSDTIAKLAGITSGVVGTVSVYTAGPLAANASTTWNMLGANYNMGATTVYAGLTTTKTDALADKAIEDSKSYNVAAKYVMGNIDFLGNFLVRKSNLNNTQAGFLATDVNGAAYATDAKMLGLGANYNFSKNTFAYIRYESIQGLNSKISSTPATVASNGLDAAASYNNAKQTKSMVGLRMAF